MNPCKRRNLIPLMSKSGSSDCSEINLEATCLLSRWHPAYRGHELNPGFSMERGNSFCDVKRKPYKCSSRKRESIEAQEGGGSSRISDEDTVMVLERRGCGNLYKSMDNQKWEEPLS